MIGMATSTRPDRRGLVTTIIATEPMHIIRLRNAVEAEAPTADFSWVVSAVRRDVSLLNGPTVERPVQGHEARKYSRPQVETMRSPSVVTR